SRAQPGLCITCHSEASCQECHTRERVGARSGAGGSPHAPGWMGGGGGGGGRGGGGHGTAARVDRVSCAGCHGGAGEQLCVGCHKVGGPGGTPHPSGGSSPPPLSALPCRMCHTTGAMR